MKKKYSKIIKTFSKAVFVCLVILCMILGIMFCSKFGQRILVDITTKYIESNGITCDINGLSKDLSKINDIFIKLADGTEIYISDVTISKNHFFEKADIHAKKLKLKTAKNSDKNLHKNNNLIADIKQSIFSYAQNFRFFIKKVTIGKAELNISEKKFHLNSIEYVSKKTDDNFQCNIFNKHYFLKCNLNWNAQSHINILFKKDEQNIFAINIKNIDTDISPITITLEKDKRIYNINGKIITKNNQIILFSKINTNDFLYALTLKNELKKHFENTFAIFNITCGFDKKIEFSVVIEKTKKIIGTLLGTINDNVINVKGKIDYNIYGYVFKNIDCEIIDFEKIYSNFIGENFDIKIAAKINNQQIEIENFIFNIPKNGFIKATKPFVVADDNKIYANFDFKLAQLAFWNKIIPISDGDANGTIVFNGDKIQTDCKGKSITFKKFGKLLNYSLSADGKNISLHAKNAIHINSIWQDLSFKTHQNKLKISGKINNFSSLVEGNISDSFKQITINKGTINSQHIICDIKHCDLDFDTDNYKILIETFNKKNKKGSLYFNNDNTSTIIELNSFQPHYMNNILGILIPQCRLDGKIKINKTKESKIGEAHITISDILSRKSSISLVSNLNKNGLTVKTVINNTEKTLKGDIFIPITFDKNNSIKNTNSIQINGHISGETYLERLFELPDRSDAKGLFSCNLYISGNLSDPKINGTASLKNGYFMIGDIFLRKGYITLQCDNNKINIVNAEFSDTKNNKLMASGTGKIFFKNLIPNIDTNVKLSCDDFKLFNSDDLEIAIKGTGKITGLINDLLISGDIELTKCKIQKMDTGSNNKNDGIIIENEINIDKQPSNTEINKEDFCRYDISMKCPKVSVIGNLFNIIFEGNLHLGSYKHQATLSGLLKLKKGKLNLFGKRLLMRKGEVEFFEKYPFDPTVSIFCSNNFNGMIVYLKIKNTPEKGVSFNLYSTPNYSQDIILSQMLFGKEMKYLSVSEAAQFAQAMSSLKQKGYIFSILNTLKIGGIIDSITFSNPNEQTQMLNKNSQTSSNKENINIRAGKYISDNLFISVNKTADEKAYFDIDYSLTPTISVKANTNGEAGISWKYKY